METERKTSRLVTLLTPSMKADIEAEAEQTGEDVSVVVRRALKNRKRLTFDMGID